MRLNALILDQKKTCLNSREHELKSKKNQGHT